MERRLLTSRDWGWRCRRCSEAPCLPCSAHSLQNRSISDPTNAASRRISTQLEHYSGTNGEEVKETHLLHLRQHILVRRELAIEAEELLLLFREFLRSVSVLLREWGRGQGTYAEVDLVALGGQHIR